MVWFVIYIGYFDPTCILSNKFNDLADIAHILDEKNLEGNLARQAYRLPINVFISQRIYRPQLLLYYEFRRTRKAPNYRSVLVHHVGLYKRLQTTGLGDLMIRTIVVNRRRFLNYVPEVTMCSIGLIKSMRSVTYHRQIYYDYIPAIKEIAKITDLVEIWRRIEFMWLPVRALKFMLRLATCKQNITDLLLATRCFSQIRPPHSTIIIEKALERYPNI